MSAASEVYDEAWVEYVQNRPKNDKKLAAQYDLYYMADKVMAERNRREAALAEEMDKLRRETTVVEYGRRSANARIEVAEAMTAFENEILYDLRKKRTEYKAYLKTLRPPSPEQSIGQYEAVNLVKFNVTDESSFRLMMDVLFTHVKAAAAAATATNGDGPTANTASDHRLYVETENFRETYVYGQEAAMAKTLMRAFGISPSELKILVDADAETAHRKIIGETDIEDYDLITIEMALALLKTSTIWLEENEMWYVDTPTPKKTPAVLDGPNKSVLLVRSAEKYSIGPTLFDEIRSLNGGTMVDEHVSAIMGPMFTANVSTGDKPALRSVKKEMETCHKLFVASKSDRYAAIKMHIAVAKRDIQNMLTVLARWMESGESYFGDYQMEILRHVAETWSMEINNCVADPIFAELTPKTRRVVITSPRKGALHGSIVPVETPIAGTPMQGHTRTAMPDKLELSEIFGPSSQETTDTTPFWEFTVNPEALSLGQEEEEEDTTGGKGND